MRVLLLMLMIFNYYKEKTKKDVLMFEGKINGRETKEIFSVEKGRSSL